MAAPLIFRLGEQIPLNKQSQPYAALIHFLLAFLFGLLHIAFFAALSALFGSSGAGSRPEFRSEFKLPAFEIVRINHGLVSSKYLAR